MIIRIVKMSFQEEMTEDFLNFFDKYKSEIRNFKGCQYLQILKDIKNPNIIFSYSYWDSEISLLNYRNSSLFIDIWSETKKKFKDPAEAWSTEILHNLK
jgi:heme-degrading monooxygenase HmoA